MEDVCKCKSGWKENPAINKPDGTDDCVETDEGRNISIIKKEPLFFSAGISIPIIAERVIIFFISFT